MELRHDPDIYSAFEDEGEVLGGLAIMSFLASGAHIEGLRTVGTLVLLGLIPIWYGTFHHRYNVKLLEAKLDTFTDLEGFARYEFTSRSKRWIACKSVAMVVVVNVVAGILSDLWFNLLR